MWLPRGIRLSAIGLLAIVWGATVAASEETAPPGNYTPATRQTTGEFARLLEFPPACQKASALDADDPSGRLESKDFCEAVVSCQEALSSQLQAGADYLKRNSEILPKAAKTEDFGEVDFYWGNDCRRAWTVTRFVI